MVWLGNAVKDEQGLIDELAGMMENPVVAEEQGQEIVAMLQMLTGQVNNET